MSPSSSMAFNHSFEGWSVWIEPCEKECEGMVKEIEFLAEKCGGADSGMHPFMPHCTLLYNLAPMADAVLSKQELGHQMLQQCLDKFRHECSPESTTCQKNSDQTATANAQHVQLVPKSFFFFPYPKHADNGKGFGCVISLILLEKTSMLQLLHEAVTFVFPPDERQENFVPHVSLVYAPETTTEWLQEQTLNMERHQKDLLQPVNARYLSLWSTQGQLHEWYRISRAELNVADK